MASESLQDLDRWAKGIFLWLAFAAIGAGYVYVKHRAPEDGAPAPAPAWQGASKSDLEDVQANYMRARETHEASAGDLLAAKRWREARPRNDAVCSQMTMAAATPTMQMHGCLLGSELPPAIMERGETVLLDDALRAANRPTTKAGAIADHPRNEVFCSRATTLTPRVDLWQNGCLPWGFEPRLNAHPVRLLDEAMADARVQVPIQRHDPAFCRRALNNANPLILWRNECLPVGEFPAFIDPVVPLQEARAHAE